MTRRVNDINPILRTEEDEKQYPRSINEAGKERWISPSLIFCHSWGFNRLVEVHPCWGWHSTLLSPLIQIFFSSRKHCHRHMFNLGTLKQVSLTHKINGYTSYTDHQKNQERIDSHFLTSHLSLHIISSIKIFLFP